MTVLDFWDQLMNQAKVYQQGFNDGSDAFAAGKVAMTYNGPWALADYDKVDGLDYGVVPPVTGPNGDKGALTGGFGLVIPKTAKTKKLLGTLLNGGRPTQISVSSLQKFPLGYQQISKQRKIPTLLKMRSTKLCGNHGFC